MKKIIKDVTLTSGIVCTKITLNWSKKAPNFFLFLLCCRLKFWNMKKTIFKIEAGFFIDSSLLCPEILCKLVDISLALSKDQHHTMHIIRNKRHLWHSLSINYVQQRCFNYFLLSKLVANIWIGEQLGWTEKIL